ncbi:hypothetical protein JTB14_007404 [Gonioctena quinquepunctata]|nr:hypothetical protein JTB14_007404 [Gonioctena quinquepunctata]
MSRNLRDILPITDNYLEPKRNNVGQFNSYIESSQKQQRKSYNKNSKNLKLIEMNKNVGYQDKLKSKWQFGKVIDKPQETSYILQKNDGSLLTRNHRFIETLPRSTNNESSSAETGGSDDSFHSSDDTFVNTFSDNSLYEIPERLMY